MCDNSTTVQQKKLGMRHMTDKNKMATTEKESKGNRGQESYKTHERLGKGIQDERQGESKKKTRNKEVETEAKREESVNKI